MKILISLLIPAILFGQTQSVSPFTAPNLQDAPSLKYKGQGLYLACHWTGTQDVGTPFVGRQLFFSMSNDGVKFSTIDTTPSLVNPAGAAITPWWQDTGCLVWYPTDAPKGVLLVAGDGNVNPNARFMQFTSTFDLLNFTSIMSVDMTGNSGLAVASPWFGVDPVTNTLYCLFQSQPSGGGNFITYWSKLNTNTYAGYLANSWTTPVALTNALSWSAIDPTWACVSSSTPDGACTPISTGNTYYLFVKANSTGSGGGTRTVNVSSSSSAMGPYAFNATTPQNPYGFPTTTNQTNEKPSIVQDGSRHWRLYMDVECGSQPYSYADSTDGAFASFSAPASIIEPSGAFTYGQGIVAGCAAGSYYMRAMQVIKTWDQNWMNTITAAYNAHHGTDRAVNAPIGVSLFGQIGFTVPFTVATLPTCNAANKGIATSVTDATSPTYNGALTGGGGVLTPVFCDGTSWHSH
jgi:hypothetical protein